MGGSPHSTEDLVAVCLLACLWIFWEFQQRYVQQRHFDCTSSTAEMWSSWRSGIWDYILYYSCFWATEQSNQP